MKLFDLIKNEGKYSGPMEPETITGKEKHGAVEALEHALVTAKKNGTTLNYENIDTMMQRICKTHNITGQKLHDDFVKKHNLIPDNWIKKVNEGLKQVADFKDILKVFLPIAKKIIKLDKMPTIIIKKKLTHGDQPTMGRFYNEDYRLELAVANRQPVDILRTLAHELTHAKQDLEHVDIDSATGSKEENEANVVAGIVMREFNRLHPEYLNYKAITEGGNLSSKSPGWIGASDAEADEIDLKVHDRSVMVPLLDKLLHDISAVFQKQFKQPLWSPQLLQSKEFLGGSSLHFFNTKGISDKDFVKHKPKVGDIDTQCDKELEPQIEQFLNSIMGKQVGDAKFLGFSRGNEQLNGLFEFQNPPMKIQIDFEFGKYNPQTKTPDDWYRFSHSSAWEDIQVGIKGVFHKYLYRSLAKAGPTEKYIAKLTGLGKKRAMAVSGPITDANFSFAVASGAGGGTRPKYKPYIDPATGQEKVIDGIPVMEPVKPSDSEYNQDLSQQFALFFGQPPSDNDSQLQQSFVGTVELMNKYLDDAAKKATFETFLQIVFEPGAQMITKDDPARDREIKFAAVDQMLERLGLKALRPQAVAMAKEYEKDYHDVEAFKKANPNERQPRAAMKKMKAGLAENKVTAKDIHNLADRKGIKWDDEPSFLKLTKRLTGKEHLDDLGQEELTKVKNYLSKQGVVSEAGEVKAQLRKGMPHLRDLKTVDFLDLLDELHQGNGQFQLKNIPLNVKVDGFGGRFGKSEDGRPFMGTSNTAPRFEAGFVAYHEKKGTTDPDILGRAKLFDDLFTEMMKAVALVDSKLGSKFLINKQVTCEVLYLPFATETPEGKLKFVGIHYDQLPQGVQLALVPFRVADATSGEDIANSDKVIKALTGLGKQGSVMFIDNSLTQNEALDVTAIVPPLENIEQLKSLLADTGKGINDRKKQVAASLEPVKLALEKAIINDPNIVGKDILGKDYEGIVLNTRLGPVKITSTEQRKVIADKQAAKVTARTERPRDNSNKTAVVAIGSFVGHAGHQELFKLTIDKAKELGGDPYLFMGNAVGKNDPIPVADKIKTWQMLYPQYAKNIGAVTMEGGSLLQKIKHELINPLPGKPPRYDNIVIMVGRDQANMQIAGALMKAVNKFQGYEHVKAKLEVTDRGTGISFTDLRNALETKSPEQAFGIWDKAFYNPKADAQQLSPEWIKHLMDVSRKGMGLDMKAKEFAEAMLPKSAFVGSNKNKLGTAGQLRNQKRGARAGDLVGGDSVQNKDKPVEEEALAKRQLRNQYAQTLGEFARTDDEGREFMSWQEFLAIVTPAMKHWGFRADNKNPEMMYSRRGRSKGEMYFIILDPQDDMVNHSFGTMEDHQPDIHENGFVSMDKHGAKVFLERADEAYSLSDLKQVAEGFGEFPNTKQPKAPKAKTEAANPAQQAAIAIAKKKAKDVEEDQRLDPKCWKGYRKQGTKMKGGTRVNNCVKIGEGWEQQINDLIKVLAENFADGKNPGRKGLAKRSGVNTKASVSSLRDTAKHSTGEKARMAHWMANMKAGKAKK
jgi:hypothetical protein